MERERGQRPGGRSTRWIAWPSIRMALLEVLIRIGCFLPALNPPHSIDDRNVEARGDHNDKADSN